MVSKAYIQLNVYTPSILTAKVCVCVAFLQVLLCDNLSLPFRDESFDAVLSVAVVHHFATTERRVGALRELARVLRIGGRLIITVWAMKQRHRKVNRQKFTAQVRNAPDIFTERERLMYKYKHIRNGHSLF
jgi:ubiquinone/menaquinone biosynthesis C-methylase UbiE